MWFLLSLRHLLPSSSHPPPGVLRPVFARTPLAFPHTGVTCPKERPVPLVLVVPSLQSP